MSEVYLTDYEEHLAQMRSHLAGNTGQPLPSSFIPPAGYWTSHEKDCFFHALAVHSRLRPDLISDSVKSKTVLDVCAYIDALDRAAAAQPPMPSLRSTLEGAMEVSDSWIGYEEEQATALTGLEPGWEEEAEEQRRAEVLASRFQDEHTYWNWKDEQESAWRKQGILKKLGTQHLQVLHKFIRNPDVITGMAPEPPSAPLPISRFHDGLIDPVLLALSSYQPIPSTPQDIPSKEPTVPNQGPSCPPERSLLPLAPAVPCSPISKSHRPPSEASSRHLSPTSRRRLAKRLHMRKKRAEAAGTEANMLPVKLAAGRKKTRVYIPKPRPHKYKPRKPNLNQELDMADDETHDPDLNAEPSPPASPSPTRAEDDDDTTTHLMDKGGVTAPYKIMSLFSGQGIDANTLTECGLDVFNISMLGKLMGVFHDGYADDEKSIASSISFDTIQSLYNILLDFTSTTVHRAISLREQEVILKRKIKVWRLDKEDKITSGNVMEALKMHGLNTHSLLSDFLEDSQPKASQDVDEMTANDDSGESLEQRFVEDESTFHARLPLHRELAPPFIPLPKDVSGKVSLTLSEINMDELITELDDEAKLDKLDCQLETRYEENLWQDLRAG